MLICVDVWFNNKFLISTLNLRKIKEIKNSKLNSTKLEKKIQYLQFEWVRILIRQNIEDQNIWYWFSQKVFFIY